SRTQLRPEMTLLAGSRPARRSSRATARRPVIARQNRKPQSPGQSCAAAPPSLPPARMVRGYLAKVNLWQGTSAATTCPNSYVMPIAGQMPYGSEDARVAVLLCTMNGAAFLREQLDSFARQFHRNWALIVSDDGSHDQTRDIVAQFAVGRPQQVVLRRGPEQGPCANFLSLATDSTIVADFFAFSDQDDVWHEDKLSRAVGWLATVPASTPALYLARTELIGADGRSRGFSTVFARPPGFRNALVQSIGGGNTMVFNRAARELLAVATRGEVVMHD